MKLFFYALFLLSAAMSTYIEAHEGHHHGPVSMKAAAELALQAAQEYTQESPPFGLTELDDSWKNLPDSAAQIIENGHGFYVVSVENPKASEILYVRILLDGTIDNARLGSGNFQGNFSAP